MRTLGWLLGIDELESIDSLGVAPAATWAQDAPFWVFAAIVALAAVALVFYLRQQAGNRVIRLSLAVIRGALLSLLFLTLAEPVLQLEIANRLRPLIYIIVDGTESMAIDDEYPPGERDAIDRAVSRERTSTNEIPSRLQYVQAMLSQSRDNLLSRLAKEHQADVETFVFDGNTTSQLRRISGSSTARSGPTIANAVGKLEAKGQVTAIGSVLNEIDQQYRSRRLAAVVLLSDFANNSGPAPTEGSQSPAGRLGVPLYAVGVGATEAIDLAVDLEVESKMKKGERSAMLVRARQNGLEGQAATVRVVAKELGGFTAASESNLIGEKTVPLAETIPPIEFSFTPQHAGRFEMVASAESVAGEKSLQNNQAARQVTVIDDYLRLMYVAYEPTWEWRFVKEVFHRDKLVGLSGFRTFLSSSDPRVREANSLFLPTLTPKRSDFFATDVLFLDDMPRVSLSDRFFELTQQYVSELGGGLVVIAGPRFGPRELYQSPLADMLPVIIDPNAELHAAPEYPEFKPRLTPHAQRYSFMRLGADSSENVAAWANIGKLPWYQPVARPHPQAEVLLEHPTEKCADGKTPQPLIAIRPYGKGGAGEVVWIGFNEMWRLRRQYGEKYYRQFWSQLIYRLGMSHALGFDKRFVVRLDQEQYRVEDKVTLAIEAYDENYEPLSDEKLKDRGLIAELAVPSATGEQVQKISVPMLRKGLFETRFNVYTAGNYGLRVTDPITGKVDEQRFEVTGLSAERREATRNEKLQQELAEATGGRSYDLTTVNRLPDEVTFAPVVERETRHIPLWTTPAWFLVVVILMLSEWLLRKLIHLP
ncbi:MAG TPA: vWA domain-containing protein [Pirellulaceae bacterium]|jgi:hypothetical protein